MMSESNRNIPLSSQESASVSEVNQELTTSVCERDSCENVKDPGSKISKPTGLKLPTPTFTPRIGRLCNNIPKPGIPRNAATNWTGVGERRSEEGETMSASSVRRISDELARKRLADVDESNENAAPYCEVGKWTFDRKLSSGSVLSDSSRKSDEFRKKRSSDASTSPDSFSEYSKSYFEPRRASDASVVLTEDTDQFIIGDRVWVGGVKPGQIAYIGETQFAPGEWAGVVLDEPIGKNDGTVANIRYFQCEPKKGIFSRLTRLTRYPLTEGGAGEPATSKFTPSENRRTNGNLASVHKKSSLVLSPSSSAAKVTLPKSSSPDPCLQPNVQVGDRVIVKSSQGSKAGVLRYLGTTDFAVGEWCGVELDDPLGKNDGSVSGTRYFECRPKFGLFAPLHKVSKSPASKRLLQGNCAIHNRGGIAMSGARRQGSKESLASLSSVASTTASVRSTAKKIGARTPTTPTSAKNALQETLKEKELHIEQLLKERDLERAEVTRAASQADEAERRLAALKQELEQQKEEAEARLSDVDAMMCLLRAENDELKSLLEDERRKCEDLQFRYEEESIEKADIKSVTIEYEEKMRKLEKSLFEERKKIEALEQDSNKLFEAEEQTVIVKEELEVAREEIEELKKKYLPLEQERISLEAQLTSVRAEMDSLKIENESLKASSGEELSNVVRLLEEQRAEAERLAGEVATRARSGAEKEKELHTKYLKIVNEVTAKLETESEKLTRELENSKSDANEKIQKLESQLEEKTKTFDHLERKLNEIGVVLTNTMAEKAAEESLRKEVEEKLERVKAEFEVKRREMEALSENQEESLKAKINCLEEAEAKRRLEVEHLNREIQAAKALLLVRDNELQKGREKVENLTTKVTTLEEKWRNVSEERDRLELLQVDKGRLLNCLEEKLSQVSSQKDKLEKDILGLKSSSTNSSVDLMKLNEELRAREKELETFKEEMRQRMQSAEKTEQELLKLLEKRETEERGLREELGKAREEVEQEREKVRVAEEKKKEAEGRWKVVEAKGTEEKRMAEEEVREVKARLEEVELRGKEIEKSLRGKVEMMSKERDKLTEMLETLERQLLNGEKEHKEKQKEAEAASREKEKLARDAKETAEKLEVTMVELAKVAEVQQKSSEEISKLKEVEEALKEQVKTLEAKNTELEMELASVKSDSKVRNELLDQLREEKCHVEKEAAENTLLLKELRSQLAMKETSRSAQEAVIKQLETEAVMLRAEVKQAEGRAAEAQALLDAERERYDKLEVQAKEAERREKEERKAAEDRCTEAGKLIKEKEEETDSLRVRLEKTRLEKEKVVNDNKRLLEVLEKEKAELEKKLEELQPVAGKMQKNQNVEDANQRRLEDEEREFQKGQVDFLNSVIVDMQKKNDALKARIEILEMGFSPEDVDEFNLHNITTRSVAPRLFCDICDRFDLHDTEDCPTQANEDVLPPKSSKAKAPQSERPYCDICEVFGHDTADCDDAETF